MLRNPTEVDYILALCDVLPSEPKYPLWSIYHALYAERRRESSPIAQHHSDQPRTEQPEISDDKTNARDDLVAAIRLARDVWEKSIAEEQTEASGDLRMLVAVCPPLQDEIECQSELPWLIMDHGSIRARLLWGAWKATDFAVCLFLNRGIAPSKWSDEMARELRRRAHRRQPAPRNLIPVQQLRASDLGGCCGIIVFVHGLLSTDLGTFDAAIDRLEQNLAFRNRVLMVGFPHDTMKGIWVNAQELAGYLDHLSRRNLDRPPTVAFVCHSRGGLVARATAAYLHTRPSIWNWKQQLRGCVTFGTPHLGAQLAEAPREMIGTVVVAQTLLGTGRFANAWDALHYVARREPTGILDMRPAQSTQDFLHQLVDWEYTALTPDRERALEVLAVGGCVPPGAGGDLQRITNRALAGTDNDLVVQSDSTMPYWSQGANQRNCDHFHYFTPEEAADSNHFGSVERFLKNVLDLDNCPYDRPDQIVVGEDTVKIGRVKVPRNRARR